MIRLMAILPWAVLLVACQAGPGPTPVAPSIESNTLGDASDPRNRAQIRTRLAALYYDEGNFAVALEELRLAAAADPTYPTVHSMFGLVYIELREMALAQQSFERALKLAPNDPDINHNYGTFLCRSNREKDSIRYFLQAIRNPLYPAPWRSYTAAGLCSLRTGNLPDAEELLQRALRLEPDEPSALLAMGQIRYRQGNFGESRNLLNQFLRQREPTPESLWLGIRVERKLGERVAESGLANQLRRRFPGSPEYQLLQRGEYD